MAQKNLKLCFQKQATIIKEQRTSDDSEIQGEPIYSTAWAQTFPKQKPVTLMSYCRPQSILRTSTGSDNSLTRRNRNSQASVKICQDPSHVSQASAPQPSADLLPSHLTKDINQHERIYTKPQYKDPFQPETDNYQHLRRRSFLNSGLLKQNQNIQIYRNSKLVEEESNDNYSEPRD